MHAFCNQTFDCFQGNSQEQHSVTEFKYSTFKGHTTSLNMLRPSQKCGLELKMIFLDSKEACLVHNFAFSNQTRHRCTFVSHNIPQRPTPFKTRPVQLKGVASSDALFISSFCTAGCPCMSPPSLCVRPGPIWSEPKSKHFCDSNRSSCSFWDLCAP